MRNWFLWGVAVVLLFMTVAPAGRAASPVPEIRVNAAEFKYNPNKITLKVGQQVKVTLVNKGAVEHDLHSEVLDFGVPAGMSGMSGMEHETVAPGKSASATLTPRKKGTFEFWCTIPGHKDAGMKGTFVVQ